MRSTRRDIDQSWHKYKNEMVNEIPKQNIPVEIFIYFGSKVNVDNIEMHLFE